MPLHLSRFVNSEKGKIIMSILLGFGLASFYAASVVMALLACVCAWRTHYLSRRDSFSIDG